MYSTNLCKWIAYIIKILYNNLCVHNKFIYLYKIIKKCLCFHSMQQENIYLFSFISFKFFEFFLFLFKTTLRIKLTVMQ